MPQIKRAAPKSPTPKFEIRRVQRVGVDTDEWGVKVCEGEGLKGGHRSESRSRMRMEVPFSHRDHQCGGSGFQKEGRYVT
jgi:hypothetical protein